MKKNRLLPKVVLFMYRIRDGPLKDFKQAQKTKGQ
jgi:hypothetical protein